MSASSSSSCSVSLPRFTRERDVGSGCPSCSCLERVALGRVALAHHLAQLRSAELVRYRCEPPAGGDRGQLAAIAGGDHLRASTLGMREQGGGRSGRRGACLVEQSDGSRARIRPPPPTPRGDGGSWTSRCRRHRPARAAAGPSARRRLPGSRPPRRCARSPASTRVLPVPASAWSTDTPCPSLDERPGGRRLLVVQRHRKISEHAVSYRGAARRHAVPRALNDRPLARQQIASREAMLSINPPERNDRRVNEVASSSPAQAAKRRRPA